MGTPKQPGKLTTPPIHQLSTSGLRSCRVDVFKRFSPASARMLLRDPEGRRFPPSPPRHTTGSDPRDPPGCSEWCFLVGSPEESFRGEIPCEMDVVKRSWKVSSQADFFLRKLSLNHCGLFVCDMFLGS